MTARTPAWIAGALWLASAAGVVGILVVMTMRDGWSAYSDDLIGVALGSLFIVPTTVGVLVASRRPRNPIGWLFCVFGVAAVWSVFASTLYLSGTESPPTAGRWLIWTIVILTPAALFAMITYLLLLFPTGRLVSPRWRPVAWLAGVLIAGVSLNAAFGEELTATDPTVRNPARIEPVGALFEAAEPLALVLIPLVVLASLLSLVQRFRRSSGVERRQLAWFVYAACLDIAALLGVLVLGEVGWGDNLVSDILFYYGVLIGLPIVIPVVVGIAILRHNLFDIDRIIHRTLVYGMLSASLGATYLACILLLGGLMRSLSGQSSDIVTAASTLAVAGLFQPLRHRIQSLVDRRFYRRKYDAARVIEQFGARLRDEVDLTLLGADLQAVAAEAVQPAHVSLWLRTAARRSR